MSTIREFVRPRARATTPLTLPPRFVVSPETRRLLIELAAEEDDEEEDAPEGVVSLADFRPAS